MTDDPMTSIFPYLAMFQRPKERAKQGYLQTWYSKEEAPAHTWDQRELVSNGWWRYTKLHPFDSVAGPEEIEFPNIVFYLPQVEWVEPTRYVKLADAIERGEV